MPLGHMGTARLSLAQAIVTAVCAPAASHTQATAAAVHPDIHSDPTADYRNLGLLQLLKKASRRRGGASVHSNNSAAQHSLVYAQTGQDLHSPGRAQSSLHSHAGQHATLELFRLFWNRKTCLHSPVGCCFVLAMKHWTNLKL